MKKILAVLLLTVSASAMAQHRPGHHGHWRHYHNGHSWNWVAPTIIGGVIGYEIARNQSAVVVQQPVIVQPQPMIVQSNCSPWTETQYPDGTITRTRTCTQ